MQEISDNVIVPFVPKDIIEELNKDFEYVGKLIKYKNDATLYFLQCYNATCYYQGTFDIKVSKDVKDWQEFLDFSKKYTTRFVQEALQYHKNKEKDLNDNQKKFDLLTMDFLEPAIITISNNINHQYYKRFPCWPESGSQEDYIKVNINNKLIDDENKLRYYWSCSGTIFVKDTKYDPPKGIYKYRAEWDGKPEFNIAYFNMEKIRQINTLAEQEEGMKQLKSMIDKCEKQLIQNKMKLLLSNFDFKC